MSFKKLKKKLTVVDVCSIKSGIYFLCDADQVIYIGQSVTPLLRISSHVGSHKFDSAFVLPVEPDKLDEFEATMIKYFRPSGNGGMGGSRKGDKASPFVSAARAYEILALLELDEKKYIHRIGEPTVKERAEEFAYKTGLPKSWFFEMRSEKKQQLRFK